MVAEILCVKHLTKQIAIENWLIPFCGLGDKIAGYSFMQLCAYSRSLGTSCELF